MPKNIVSFRFTDGVNPYTSDLDINYTISSRFNAPPDIDGIAAAAIVTAAGGIITNEPTVCSDGATVYPRKLQFIRSSGNTISVAVGQRADLISAATAIKGVLDGANGGNNPVVCIKLYGEETPNLNDELGLIYDGTTFAPTHKAPADALKQNYVSGVISYQSDASNPIGETVLQSIRSITEKAVNEFAAQLGAVPNNCGLEVLNVLNCPGNKRNPRKHRRFELGFATKVDTANDDEASQTETIELPVAGASGADISACGNAAAALTGIYCIGYRGESYDRFHKLLNNNAPNLGGGGAGA